MALSFGMLVKATRQNVHELLLKIIPDGTISVSMLSDKIITESANLFSDLPHSLPEELIEILVDAPNVRIERIISTGHASPPGFWYEQAESEWVVVLRGEAVLVFEDEIRILRPGDYVFIPPHRKHRVNSTSKTYPTVWLAVFFGGKAKESQ
jgi:cupin 2 domain-containing protein